eukprot:jgi/Chrpa1/14404/Chrysochromulina_OHIO_Genome00021981-RA
MMDDAPTEDGVYPVPTIAAAELAVLREMCEADSRPARLEQCSISELFRLVEGASFLDAPGALNHAQCALATRLNGKRADELRELLGATDDFGSAENRVAALAEPAFSPGGQLSVATAGSAAGPPALQPQPQPSLSGMAVADDAKEVALGMVDVGTLAELKGVSQSWLALARRVLCSRLSRCEGQPEPTQMAEITDLNIKVLVDAGRPWEAAAAGRVLPSLARLRWEGLEVSVAAVREVDLETPRQEREFLGGRAKAALLSCIEGEGEPPLELLLAAVTCAGSGEIRGIPVQMMRGDSVSELDLQARNIGVEGGMLLAYLLPVMGALTSLNLSRNELCGLDENGRGTYTAVGIAALADAMRVNGGLTKLSLAQNKLEEEGTKAICEALEQNTTLKELDISGDRYGQSNIGGTAGAKHVAKMLGVNGSLTSVKLSGNKLRDEGWGAIFAAICGNKDSKILFLDVSREDISPAGVQLIAEALRTSVTGALTRVNIEMFNEVPIKEMRADSFTELDLKRKGVGVEGGMVVSGLIPVMGGLTALNLSSNSLKDEGVNAVCEVIQSNKETKLASLNFSYNGIGPVGANAVAAMVAVTGGLTRVDVRHNIIAGDSAAQLAAAVLRNLKIEMFNAIPIKEMRADSFTVLDLKEKDFGVEGGMVVAGLIPVMGGLTSLDLSNNALCGVTCMDGTYTAEGITAIAHALRVNGGLTKLSLAGNQLEEEGTKAICEALEQNKTLKELDISGRRFGKSNFGGTAGAKHVAKMVGINGALTVTIFLGNQLNAESAKMLAEVAKQKGISLCGIQRDQTTADFRGKGLKPPD